MSILPQVNAQLLSVTSGGFNEDYDRPATAGTAEWTGSEPAYVMEKLESGFNASGGLNRAMVTTIFVNPSLTTFNIGDKVTYLWRGQTFTARIQNINAPKLPGSPYYLKATLEQVNAA